MKKHSLEKTLLSPIAVIFISILLTMLESKAPLKNFVSPIGGHAPSYIELLFLFWFYAAIYHAFFFFKKFFVRAN